MKVIVVRDGAAILFSEFGPKPVHVANAILLAANALCGREPEGRIPLRPDYVIGQVFWQHVGVLHHCLDAQDFCLDAQDFAATIYTEPTQILRLIRGDRCRC